MASLMKSFLIPKAHGAPSTFVLGDIERPTITSPDQVLLHVKAASLNPIDMRYAEGTLKLMQPTASFPTKFGYDASGVIESLGPEAEAKGWKVGDEIFVRLPHADRGSLSEYAVTKEFFIAKKPKNLTHVEAASIPLVGMTAYQVFGRGEGGRDAINGSRVLVTGGLGGAGSIGVQIAKALGASEVITTVSTRKMERAKELFAGKVDTYIDYTKQDITKEIQPKSLDFIFDTVGGITPLYSLLKPNHSIISIAVIAAGSKMKEMFPSMPWWMEKALNLNSRFRLENPAKAAGVHYDYHCLSPNGKDLAVLSQWAEEGKIKPVIGDVFDFTQEGCVKACELVQKNGSPNGGKICVQIVKE